MKNLLCFAAQEVFCRFPERETTWPAEARIAQRG